VDTVHTLLLFVLTQTHWPYENKSKALVISERSHMIITVTHSLNRIFVSGAQNRENFTGVSRGDLSYLAPLGSENISAPYFRGVVLPPRLSQTTRLPVPRQK